MKKMVALALAITMLVSLASVASASKSINLNVSCTSTTNYARSNETEKKNTDSKMIYARHFDNVDTEAYTNHFRGQNASNNWTTCGSKWCTQGMNVPIQNNNITSPNYYSIAARGNTNYYDYDGVSSIWLSGTFYVNYPN